MWVSRLQKPMFQQSILFNMFATSKFQSYKDVKISNSQISKTFMRSSGPGGQSVNTTNSKAEVRLFLKQCSLIDDVIMNNLQQKYSNYINKQGQLIVSSQMHKSQNQNLAECMMKLQKIIFNCSQVSQERKYEIPAETEEEQDNRIQQKRWRGSIKKRRIMNKKYI